MTFVSTALAALLLTAAAGGKSKLELGQKAFNQGEFDSALKHLDAAVSEASDAGALEKIHLMRGQCFAARQDFGRAEEAFAQALEANPEASLDPAKVDPSLVKVLDSLRARTKGTLTVRSTPEGAGLKLDGAPFGKAPQSAQVPIGRHKVEIQYEGVPAVVAEVVVRTNGVASVEAVQAPGTNTVLPPAELPKDASALRPFADVRAVFETGTPEFSLEIGGGIEVPWVRLGVYLRVLDVGIGVGVLDTFHVIPRGSLVVPLGTAPFSALIELEVPLAFGFPQSDVFVFGIGVGGAAGVEWLPWKWLGIYAQLGGRYYFTSYAPCCTAQGRFDVSSGFRLRLP